MRKPINSFIGLGIVCALSLACAGGCGPKSVTPAQYRQIYEDPSLGPTQRAAAIAALEASSSEQSYIVPVAGVVAGLAILIAALVLKYKMQAATRTPGKRPVKHGKTTMTPGPHHVPLTSNKSRKAQALQPAPTEALPAAGIAWTELPLLPDDALPETWAAVNAIPLDRRGASFFTSRPLAVDDLVEVSILIGDQECLVLATREEANQRNEGKMPLVRAFTVHGRTVPWYEWTEYEPYADYYAAKSQDWQGFSCDAVACWMSAENCDPRLRGYSEPIPAVDESEVEIYDDLEMEAADLHRPVDGDASSDREGDAKEEWAVRTDPAYEITERFDAVTEDTFRDYVAPEELQAVGDHETFEDV